MTDPLAYRGPAQQYTPYLDHSSIRVPVNSEGAQNGYADIEYLLAIVAQIAQGAKSVYDQCVLEMNDYTLSLDTKDTVLMESHKMSYPDDDTPDSISFAEYIYNFSVSQSTSSQYVNKYYENKVRGIYGTNALDVAHVVRIIYLETTRIQDFLSKYTGEIDDPSEFRTIETFQSWAQDTQNVLAGFRQALSQKAISQIPAEEMAQLDEGKSKEFQGLFQSKLNVINAAIGDLLSQLYKDWDSVSQVFYDKVLGPSLKFTLNVSNNITTGLDSTLAPTLYQEANVTRLGLNSQLQVALEDQVKRNRLFYQYAAAILQNITQRDLYVKYLDQLSEKGTVLPNPFITQIKEQPAGVMADEVELGYRIGIDYSINAGSSHDLLTDRDSAEAHPQYVLKDGDTIEGDLFLNGDLTLNGAKITNLFYLKNGVSKIRSSSIDWSNVQTDDTSEAPSASVPSNLSLTARKPLLDGKIECTIRFEVANADGTQYEFEVIEL